jgi:RNA polymerase sigma-70 factor (ECF subfamily)
MTDNELISGVIAKDRASVTCLVDTYQKKVIKTAYYFLGNMDDAEDVAQEVFLEILNSMKSFRRSSALSTWIYRITVNRSLNAVKRNKQRQIFTQIEKIFGLSNEEKNGMLHGATVENNIITDRETRKLLKETISRLPGQQRTVFILSKYEELSYKEISEVTGLSLSSVESLLHRAKMNLQKKLACHFSEYQ